MRAAAALTLARTSVFAAACACSGASVSSIRDTDEVDFTRDADASGAIDTGDASESLRFRRNGAALESYVAGGVASWLPIADSVVETSPTFRYYRCDGTEITTLPANATDRAAISRIDVSLAVDGSGGIQFVRRETESVHLRNKVCS